MPCRSRSSPGRVAPAVHAAHRAPASYRRDRARRSRSTTDRDRPHMSMATRGRALWVGLAVLTLGVVAVVFFVFLRDDSPEGGGDASAPLPEVRTGYVLDRADPAVGGPDAVISFDLETGETSVAYSAERIVTF